MLIDSYNEAILAFQGLVFILNLEKFFVKSLDFVPIAFQNTSVSCFIINTIPYKYIIKQNLPAEFIHLFFPSGPMS